MRQLVQSVRSGALRLIEVPVPQIGATEVLVDTSFSLVSAGTERAVRQLASASLLQKARARPDLVRQVVRKARTDGALVTARAVRSRLDDEMPLGYSAAGTVLEVGEAVAGVRPGDRVATGGAGHAEIQAVAGLLAARIPDGVPDRSAAFATVGSIALHGLRLADVGPGSRVAVIGLGLVGQLAARLARAAGCEVVGIDVRPWAVERSAEVTADLALVEAGADTTTAVEAWTKGIGVDAILVTAATSSSEPMRRAPDLARDRATIVLVGDVGLDLDRRPLYEKELSIKVARSYGPGRYERAYEEWGVDYPAGQLRWTEGRNLDAFLGLLERGRLTVDDLVTHQFPFDDALEAYGLLDSPEPYIGVELTYESSAVQPAGPVSLRASEKGDCGIGLIGAGAFARGVLVPSLKKAGFERFTSIASSSGLSAVRLGEREGFERAVQSAEAVIEDPEVSVVVIATPHDTHARLVIDALRAGKHVFCEKPLAITIEELSDVEAAWRESGCQLWAGFNRRFSPALIAAQRHLAKVRAPAVINYRINAGPIAPAHWYADRRQGGRLLGEVCHFVDTCTALIEEQVTEVSAFTGSTTEAAIGADVVVALRFGSGSLATITYAGGGSPATEKERIEILSGSHTLVIDDFRSLTIDGTKAWGGPQDKGHDALLQAFHHAVRNGSTDEVPTKAMLASSRSTLRSLGTVLGGQPNSTAADR